MDCLLSLISCSLESLEDLSGFISCEILSEVAKNPREENEENANIVELVSFCLVILTMFVFGESASVSTFKVGSTITFEQCAG